MPEVISLWNRNFESDYMREQVENILALSKAKYGDYKLVSTAPIEQGRAFSSLSDKEGSDIVIGGISTKRENASQLLYFPMDKGLLGIRLCLVSNQKRFDNIKGLDSLVKQNIVFGSGTHWPDTLIIEENGLKVAKSAKYKNLFLMLSRNRFDCMQRSIAEIGYELKAHSASAIMLEEKLAFIYPMAEFMFINETEPELYERMQYGLARAVENNSFSNIYERHHGSLFDKYSLEERTLIYLENPFLSERAAEAISRYGIRPES